MNTNEKGFAPIATILLILAGIVVVGAAFYLSYLHTNGSSAPAAMSGSTSPVATLTPSSTTPSSSAPIPPTKKPPLYPASGPIGSAVVINGSGFSATENTVMLNGLVAASLKDLPSADGKTIRFTVPQTLAPNCKPDEMCAEFLVEVAAGNSYDVSVISNGATQEVGPFMVTGN